MVSGTFSVESLTLQGNAAIDMGDARLTIDYQTGVDPISAIQSYIVSGYAGGAWDGSGIFSSSVAAANAAGGLYGIGYADGADGVVAGLSAGQIEIMPTLLGDAALTGTVGFGDFQLLAQGFGSSAGWDLGNFTYGSGVNFGDFQLLAQNFGQTASLSAGTGSAVVIAAVISSPAMTTTTVAEATDDSPDDGIGLNTWERGNGRFDLTQNHKRARRIL